MLSHGGFLASQTKIQKHAGISERAQQQLYAVGKGDVTEFVQPSKQPNNNRPPGGGSTSNQSCDSISCPLSNVHFSRKNYETC